MKEAGRSYPPEWVPQGGSAGAVLSHEYAAIALNMQEQIKMARPIAGPEVADIC